MRTHALIFVVAVSLCGGSNLSAQAAQAGASELAARGDATDELPITATRRISFTATELTWSSIAISPDGKTLVFDAFGDLYTLPVNGGMATRLTKGVAMDMYAQFSPDGSQIAFISDRSGKRQLWVMRSDGTALRRLSDYQDQEQHNDVRVRHPRWSPDGRSIMVMLYPDKLASVDVASGTLTVLFQQKGFGNLEPGYFESDGVFVVPAGPSAGNDSRTLFRLDVRTREAARLFLADKVLIGARATPDQKLLTYLHVPGGPGSATLAVLPYGAVGDSAKRARELLTGHFAVALWRRDYAITPDSRAAIINHNGRIIRVDLETAALSEIPFSVRIAAELGPLNYNEFRLTDGPISVKHMHSVQRSRDGRELIFVALNKLWRQRGDRPAERLTRTASLVREFHPRYSPDGQWLMWASWSERDGGQLWKAPSVGGAPVLLSRDTSRLYTEPQWMPDGRSIVVVSSDGSSGACPPTNSCYNLVLAGQFVRIPGPPQSVDATPCFPLRQQGVMR